MGIRIKKREKGTSLPPRREGWGKDGGAPYFLIHRRTDTLVRLARKEAVDPDDPVRTQKAGGFQVETVDNIKDELLAERLTYHFLAGWESFTARDLSKVLEPSEVEIDIDTADLDAPIPFDDEWRQTVAEHAAFEFRMWIGNIAGEAQAFHGRRLEALAKNSGSTSVGT